MAFLLAALLGLAACRLSPEDARERYLDQADAYRDKHMYREAIVEYRNALGLKRDSRRALAGLGVCYFEIGDLQQAFRFLLSSRQIEGGNMEVRQRLGVLHLVAGFAKQARREAAWLVNQEPNNLDALVLLAESSARPSDVADAILCLESVRPAFGGRARFLLALGTLYLRHGDPGTADMLFAEALAVEPRTVDDHLALGNFFVASRDLSRAEEQFRIAAELAPPLSPARLRLADFYGLLDRRDDARGLLREVVRQAPDHVLAWRRIAEIAFRERDFKETKKALDKVLAEDPSDPDGMLLLGRLQLAKGNTQEAIQAFQVVVLRLEEWGAGPRLADTRYELARAHLQAGNFEQAKTELIEATRAMPEFDEARMLLAEMEIRTHDYAAAFDILKAQLGRTPGLARAHELLGAAYMDQGNARDAVETYRRFCRLAPKEARGPHYLGLAYRKTGDLTAAREQFEAALALDPDFVEPLTQLVALSFAAKTPDQGIERIRLQIGRSTRSGALYRLLGAAYFAGRDYSLAEAAYLRSIELDPTTTDAYIRLGDLYATSRRYDDAAEKMQAVLKNRPDDMTAHMILGIIYQQANQMLKAQREYEQVLELRPDFGPAANNLATIHLEYRKDPATALRYAQTARELAPDDPYVADTLGWILYAQGLHRAALGVLRESAIRLDQNPVVQFHLGMAYHKLDEADSAKKALGKALALDARFADADQARRILAQLETVPSATP
jgi:tetratricopeptide (TPR) repeat protein